MPNAARVSDKSNCENDSHGNICCPHNVTGPAINGSPNVYINKMENGSTFEQALSTIYGVDIMEDNVQLCRDRLLCRQEHLRHIVEKNIVCHDALTYDYSFGENDENSLFEEPLPVVKVEKSKPKK